MYDLLIKDLIEIFNNNGFTAIVLNNTIVSKKIKDEQIGLYTKLLYGVVEKKLLLDYYVQPFTKGKRIKPYFKCAIRIGIYAVEYLNIANHYIINELVEVVKHKDYNASKLVNGIFRSYLRDGKQSLDSLDEENKLSLILSLPYALTKYLYAQYGNKLLEYFDNNNTFNTYRINYLKINQELLEVEIKKLSLTNLEYKINGSMLTTNISLINTDLFKNGYIIAQDASSIAVGDFLTPKAGSVILDACSAPGGKSMHIASLMQNQGEIICGDIYQSRLDKICENATKLGVKIINTILADATCYDYNKMYDIVLADVPCSGLGVIGHKPDLKYHISMQDIEDIILLQEHILNHVCKYVKLDGILLYSTCTINQDENQKQIAKFLNNHHEFSKLEEKIILPSANHDGFYMCKMVRGNND